MTREIKFKGCKHLDFSDNYTNCKKRASVADLYAYWERGEVWTDGGTNPRDVQFCKKRGRLNFKSACVHGCAECSDYEECEHKVIVEEFKEEI